MNSILHAWNILDESEAVSRLLHCCASRRWANAMVKQKPFASEQTLLEASDVVWSQMAETDWMEAFAAHPRIGEHKASAASAQSTAWSKQEQSSVDAAKAAVLHELAEGNLHYEQQFGFTYIVCATGKSTEQMLDILKRRLGNTRESELREAAEQQRQIAQIRLHKWLAEEPKL